MTCWTGGPSPTASAHQFETSVVMTAPVSKSLTEGSKLDASAYRRDATRALLKAKTLRSVEMGKELTTLLVAASATDRRRINQGRSTGGWLTAEPSTLNGTELTVDEFRDSLRL